MSKNVHRAFIEMINARVIVQLYEPQDPKPKLLTDDDFELKFHDGEPYLRLEDISEQVEEKYPNTSLMIDVWLEFGLHGHIFRYANRKWIEHGTTRGYA